MSKRERSVEEINAAIADYKAQRKAQLDRMPRCEVPDCRHRATYDVAGVGLCGWHLHRMRAEHVRRMAKGPAHLALFGPPVHYPREEILRMAQSRARL